MKSKYSKQTKVMYERYLNELYADTYSEEQAFEQLEYLCNRSRGQYTTDHNLRLNIINHTTGTLLRRLDSTAFEVGYREWKD